MADNVSKETRTRTMRAVKSKDSKMEVRFRSALWRSGLRFYKNAASMVGKPDIVFPRKKVVIFLDSCFWHGCPLHLRRPSSNVEYWQAKIDRNKSRDAKVNETYAETNWRVIRFWEHELKQDFERCVNRVIQETKG
ncbi:MAG: very short patch repair endonuclease [Pyrinomonadaceae bacterium]